MATALKGVNASASGLVVAAALILGQSYATSLPEQARRYARTEWRTTPHCMAQYRACRVPHCMPHCVLHCVPYRMPRSMPHRR